MALPTAPLGQLGNMSMPYAIPTYEVRRGRDQVLTALAAGLAQQLGGQLVENAMSRDFAEKPAGFWSKLVAGPKENRAQFEGRQERTMKAEQAEKDRTAQMTAKDREIQLAEWLQGRREAEGLAGRELERELNQARLTQMGTQAENEAALRRELATMGNEAQLAQIDRQATHTGRLNEQARFDQQAFQQVMQQIELENQIQLLKERAALEAGSPQGQYYLQQARMLEQQVGLLNGRLGGARSNDVEAVQRYLAQQQEQARLSAMPFDAAMQDVTGQMTQRDPALMQPVTKPTVQAPQVIDPVILEMLQQARATQQAPRF